MSYRRKIFSLLLALTLILSFMPAMAYADDFDDGDDNYPEEGENWLSDYYDIEFEDELFNLYSDGDFNIRYKAEFQGSDESDDTADLQFDYALSYCICGAEGIYDDEDLIPLENADNKFFTASGGAVTLHCPAIREEIGKLLGENEISDCRFVLTVSAIDASDVYTDETSNFTEFVLEDPYDQYKFLDDEQEIMLEGQDYYLDKERSGWSYGANCDPEGDEFDFTIKSIKSSNTSILKVTYDKNDERFTFSALKKGKSTLTITYLDKNGETKTQEIEAIVSDAIYDVYFDSSFHNNKYVLPGGEMTVKVHGIKETIDGEVPCDFDYNWKADSDRVTITKDPKDPGTAVLKFAKIDDVDDDDNGEYDVTLVVELIADGEVKAKTDEEEIEVRNIYYNVVGFPNVDPYLKKNASVKVDPTIIEISLDHPEGVDYTPKTKNYVEYDTDVFTVKDSEGNVIESEGFFKGPCTVTRKSYDEGTFSVDFCHDGEEYEDDFYNFAGRSFEVEELLNLADYAEISKISDKVYSGKEIKPNPVVKVYDDDDYYELDKGKDYTVSYENNKSVGIATVKVSGIGQYYGSIKKTFKINPKPTSLSSVKAGKKSLTVNWKKQATQTTGYQIQYGLKSNFSGAKKVTISKNKTVKTTIKKLKSKKKYYVRVRTYKKIGKTTYYSTWSKSKSTKVK